MSHHPNVVTPQCHSANNSMPPEPFTATASRLPQNSSPTLTIYGVPAVAASLDMFHLDMCKAKDVKSVNKHGDGEEEQVRNAKAEAVTIWEKSEISMAVLENGRASVTAVSSWLQPHPLALKAPILVKGTRERLGEGQPGWLEIQIQLARKAL